MKSALGWIFFTLLGMQSGQVLGAAPVAERCASEMAKFCLGKEHVRGQVRSCLEAHRTELSTECAQALDTTGPGKGQGRGKPKRGQQGN